MLNGRVSSAARVAAALLAMAISVAVIAASARFADTIREAHSPPETPSERPAELVYDDV
jgi:hypothetical protein